MEEEQKENMEQTSEKSFNPMIVAVIVGLLLVSGVGLLFLRGGSSEVAIEELDQVAGANYEEMAKEEGEMKIVNVEGGSFYFDPNEIRVKKGDTVKVVLSSVSMQHDFVIDELNVKTDIIPNGNTGEVVFVVDKAGEFEFYCSVANHRAQGMVGKLIVE